MTLPAPRSAEALGAIRAAIHGFFLVQVALTSFSALGRLPVTIMHPPGIMEYLSWKFYDRLITPNGMLALQALLLVSLLASTLGWQSRWTTKTSLALIVLYQGILRCFGHFNHDEMAPIYCLTVLAFSPCADGFSLDARRNAVVRPEAFAYSYPVFLMQLLVAWAYCSAGLLKLRIAGWEFFSPDSLTVLSIQQSLDNLHDTPFRLALLLPDFLWMAQAASVIAVAWEVLFPLAVFFPRLRWVFLPLGPVFHVSTMLLMNITFPCQMALYVVFFDWPELARRFRRRWSR